MHLSRPIFRINKAIFRSFRLREPVSPTICVIRYEEPRYDGRARYFLLTDSCSSCLRVGQRTMFSALFASSKRSVLLLSGLLIATVALIDWLFVGDLPLGFLYLLPMSM